MLRCFVCENEQDGDPGDRCEGCGARGGLKPIRGERVGTGPICGPSRVPIRRPIIPELLRQLDELLARQ